MLRDRSGARAWGFTPVALVAVLAGASLSAPEQEPVPLDEPPNILIIVTDDQRAQGTLKVLPQVRKWFGRGGTRYDNAFATTPTCCPSRASIFTGTYAHNHGVKTSQPRQFQALDQQNTLQRYLNGAGYRTALFGKYLNGWSEFDDPPHFDDWAVFADSSSRAYKRGHWNVQGVARVVERYATNYIKRKALGFLEDTEQSLDEEEPWFMYLAPPAPHAPHIVARQYRGVDVHPLPVNPAMQEQDRSDKPPYVQQGDATVEYAEKVRAGHLRTLMSVDDMVRAVMERLEEMGEAENTLAFFLSDNGFLWAEHGVMGKRYPFTGSIGIPFLARWPGRIPEGVRSDDLVATVDMAPTILEAAGVEIAHPVDGQSLIGAQAPRDRILVEYWKRADRTTPDWASVRTPTYQYVEHYLADRFVVTYQEYYDLVEDPWQLDNLLGDADPGNDPEPAQISQLSLLLRRDIGCSGRSEPTACP